MNAYLLGLATIPLLAGVAYLAALVIGACGTRWRRWRPRLFDDPVRRAEMAAGIGVSHRMVYVPVIGGAVVWYSTVDPTDERWLQARAYVLDALREAERDVSITGRAS